MRWRDTSPRDIGRRCSLETRFEISGPALRIIVWRSSELSPVWLVNCHVVDLVGHMLQALNPRAARIEAIEVVSRELEKAHADLQLMKQAVP